MNETIPQMPEEKGLTLGNYIKTLSKRLMAHGHVRTAETRLSALRSFMKYRGGADLELSALSSEIVQGYEAWLMMRGVMRNTSSFYMRNLHAAYSEAVKDGLVRDAMPFGKVYKGVDKTVKRALSRDALSRIRDLDLSKEPKLELARDLLMFSFYARGMSFVDMAFLRRSNVSWGHIEYRRSKTSQLVVVEIVPEMQAILDKYPTSTGYLLPIIQREDGTERKQYRAMLAKINRHLKKIEAMAQAGLKLSSYVSRHTWATIAHYYNLPISIISQAMGHDNEATTKIYLASLEQNIIDEANRQLIKYIQ